LKKIFNYLCLFVLLFLPLCVNAETKDIKIKSIELVEKTQTAEELEQPSYEGLKIDFNLRFKVLNDNAKYKVIISNTSDKEYKINDKKTEFTEEEFITYDFNFEDDSSIVKPNTEKVMYITVTYHKKVTDESYVNDVYKNDNYMNLSLSTDKVTEEINNPKTGIEHILFVISFIIFAILLTTYIVKDKKNAPIGMVLLLGLMLIPITVKAIEEIKVEINAHVEISKPRVLNFGICENEYQYQYEEFMTFNDWVNSKYNYENVIFVEEADYIAWNYVYFIQKRNPVDSELIYVNKSEVIDSNTTYLCETIAECVSPESKILTTLNGDTIKAKNIKENDSIIYYDEKTKSNKIGKVRQVFIHKDATDFIRYTFEDNSYLEATDYHPIYTKEGWKSYTNRNGYEKPQINDQVKTNTGWKKITKIETYKGKEDYYDFSINTEDGKIAKNYYANNSLVEGSY